jgi:hypothetical protein
MRNRVLIAIAVGAALAACGSNEPSAPGRLTVHTTLPKGPIYIEGSATRLRIADDDGTVLVDEPRGIGTVGELYDRRLPAGAYELMSVQLPCNGSCENLDRPAEDTRCELGLEIKSGATTQVWIDLTATDSGPRVTCTATPLSREEYQGALFGLLEQASGLAGDYTQLVVRRRPRAACARMLRRFIRRLYTLAEKAAAMHPPADAAEVHRRTVRAGQDSLATVMMALDSVNSGDVSCGRELNSRLYGLPSTKRMEAGMRELERLGYHLGLG